MVAIRLANRHQRLLMLLDLVDRVGDDDIAHLIIAAVDPALHRLQLSYHGGGKQQTYKSNRTG